MAGQDLTIPYNLQDPSVPESWYASNGFMNDLFLQAKLNPDEKQVFLGFQVPGVPDNYNYSQWQDILLETRKDDLVPRAISVYANQAWITFKTYITIILLFFLFLFVCVLFVCVCICACVWLR